MTHMRDMTHETCRNAVSAQSSNPKRSRLFLLACNAVSETRRENVDGKRTSLLFDTSSFLKLQQLCVSHLVSLLCLSSLWAPVSLSSLFLGSCVS